MPPPKAAVPPPGLPSFEPKMFFTMVIRGTLDLVLHHFGSALGVFSVPLDPLSLSLTCMTFILRSRMLLLMISGLLCCILPSLKKYRISSTTSTIDSMMSWMITSFGLITKTKSTTPKVVINGSSLSMKLTLKLSLGLGFAG